MALFLLQTSICWLLFYALYLLIYERLTFFQYNRWYLLSALIMGVIIPLLAPYVSFAKPEIVAVQWSEINFAPFALQPEESGIDWSALFSTVVWTVYSAGVALLFTRMCIGLAHIYKMYQKGVKSSKDGFVLVQTNSDMLPFSFFKWVFLGKKFDEGKTDKIIQHELVHIEQQHTFDILLTEVLKCIFWFNPMVKWYKKSLKQAHEYIADYYVTQGNYNRDYIHLLLNTTTSGLQSELTNQFFNSEIKSRITMMTKNKTPKGRLLNYLLFIPALLTMGYVFASNIERTNVIASDSKEANVLDGTAGNEGQNFITKLSNSFKNFTSADTIPTQNLEVLKVVEEMPRFPGCEDMIGTANEKEECAKRKLMEYIYMNVKYPAEARTIGVQGQAVVQFTVMTDGTLGDIEVVRDPGTGLGEAAKQAIASMNAMPTRWTPGKQDGEIRLVRYTVPLKFKLADDVVKTSDTPTPSTSEQSEIYKVVEEMPRFPGCESMIGTSNEKENCAKTKLMEYIYNNLKYPSEARTNGIEGQAVVQFTVMTDGTLADINVVRDPGFGLGDAAGKAVESMNNMPNRWTPGKQKGVSRKVQYTIPIKFKMTSSEAKTVIPRKVNELLKLNKIVDYDFNGVVFYNEKQISPQVFSKLNISNQKMAIFESVTDKKEIAKLGLDAKYEFIFNFISMEYIKANNLTYTPPPPRKRYFIDGMQMGKTKVDLLPEGNILSIDVREATKNIGSYDQDVFIVTKKNNALNNKINELSAKENPVTNGRLSLNIDKLSKVNSTFMIVDQLGKVLFSKQVDLAKEDNPINDLDISNYAKGMLYITVSQGKQRYSVKVANQ